MASEQIILKEKIQQTTLFIKISLLTDSVSATLILPFLEPY